jgi:nicotinamide riboside kinase
MKIISFTGNGSTGKTTCMTRAISHLKENKIRVGYVFDIVRGTLMDKSLLDSPTGRLYALWRHLEQEYNHRLRSDVDVLLLDRSAVDWYCYYQMELASINKYYREFPNPIRQMTLDIADSYHSFIWFNTEGFDYVRDGFRPNSKKLRNTVDDHYKHIHQTLLQRGKTPIHSIQGDSVKDRIEQTLQYMDNVIEEIRK